jgi:DNA helicase HerA-like ATPase
MLPNHGAKALNESLLTTIRLQRHYGVRVLISTQEPTLLTDLIALCSVTIIHRFSSPEWFAAIKRHIPMHSNEYHETMEKIERLKTGMALVYAPAAALSIDKQGKLVNGVSQLLKLKVRKRVTNDGGMSVLAV